jgi:hypothetical protein
MLSRHSVHLQNFKGYILASIQFANDSMDHAHGKISGMPKNVRAAGCYASYVLIRLNQITPAYLSRHQGFLWHVPIKEGRCRCYHRQGALEGD